VRSAAGQPMSTSAAHRGALAAVLAAALVAALAALGGCARAESPARSRTLFFRGEPVAQVQERILEGGPGRSVRRQVTLGSGELVLLTARLDAAGFVQHARYQRGERRRVALEGGRLSDERTGVVEALSEPAVLLDLLHHVQPARPTAVSFVDLSSGEVRAGRVERQAASIVALDERGGVIARANVEGLRTGPGAFFEGDTAPSLDQAPVEVPFVASASRGARLVGVDDVLGVMQLSGPGQRRDAGPVIFWDASPPDPAAGAAPVALPDPGERYRAPALFVESEAAAVIAFAREHGRGRGAGEPAEALADAARLAEAVHRLVNPARRDVPPSALTMLAEGGDCDGAAALLTASLRALGHAARPAVGYRRVDGRFVPHAWVEVYTAEGWILVDAAVPRVGADQTHLKLFEGLGSALTMGRVLGRLRLEPVP
jgi:transglutaminase-like putative cysteine protease